MDKEAIASLLEEKNSQLITWLERQPLENWTLGPSGKWTTGQHALHLLQSIKPVNDALSIPKFLLRFMFGTCNRPVHDYDTVAKHYLEQLDEHKDFIYKPSRNMKVPSNNDKKYLLDRLQVESKKLQYKTLKMSEKDLDTLALPHPLMGKMPVRELLQWTAFHIDHHSKNLQENY